MVVWPLKWEIQGEQIYPSLQEKLGSVRAIIEKIENYLEFSKPLGSAVTLLFLWLITTTSTSSVVPTFKIYFEPDPFSLCPSSIYHFGVNQHYLLGQPKAIIPNWSPPLPWTSLCVTARLILLTNQGSHIPVLQNLSVASYFRSFQHRLKIPPWSGPIFGALSFVTPFTQCTQAIRYLHDSLSEEFRGLYVGFLLTEVSLITLCEAAVLGCLHSL